jgi:hypothetical protein
MTVTQQADYSPAAPAHWRRWFASWQRLVSEYCGATEYKDAPFNHSEPCNAGILAAAAWQSGLVALQEYQSTSTMGSTYCKPDIWVASPGQVVSERIETKLMHFGGLGSEREVIDLFSTGAGQLSRVSPVDFDPHTTWAVVVFCVLCAGGDAGKDVTSETRSHLRRLSRLDADAIVVCVPERLLLVPAAKIGDYHHPGVVLMARQYTRQALGDPLRLRSLTISSSEQRESPRMGNRSASSQARRTLRVSNRRPFGLSRT